MAYMRAIRYVSDEFIFPSTLMDVFALKFSMSVHLLSWRQSQKAPPVAPCGAFAFLGQRYHQRTAVMTNQAENAVETMHMA